MQRCLMHPSFAGLTPLSRPFPSCTQLKSAILNILSLGRIGSIVYYVTSGLETDTHSRFWVRAFSCRSKEHAQFLCSHVMTICEIVQPGWTPRRGTQLSLLSLASRGSGYSVKSGQSITSGLSTGQVRGFTPRSTPLQPPSCGCTRMRMRAHERGREMAREIRAGFCRCGSQGSSACRTVP